MANKATALGKMGEDIAFEYLCNKGYFPLFKNWRSGHLEVDLIMETDRFIVFVEVKTRTSDHWGNPADFVDDKKQIKLMDAAESFIEINDPEKSIRFDIVGILFAPDGNSEIEHIEDAF